MTQFYQIFHTLLALGYYSIVYLNYFPKQFPRMHPQPSQQAQSPQQLLSSQVSQHFYSNTPTHSSHPQYISHQTVTPKAQRAMYKSTIQPTNISFNSTAPQSFGQLSSMCRAIGQEREESKQSVQNMGVFSNTPAQTFSFSHNKSAKTRMASSVIFPNNNNLNHNGPFSFTNSLQKQKAKEGMSGLQFLVSKARAVEESQVSEVHERKGNKENFYNQKVQVSKNNREMFKSSIQGQSKSLASSLNFQPQFLKNGAKKFQFHRKASENAKTNNISSVNQKVVTQTKQKQEGQVSASKTIVPFTPASVNSASQPATGENSMFKKKNSPYPNSSQNGKTDDNLLKMIGINTKGVPKQQIMSPKNFQNITLEPKSLNKPLGTLNFLQNTLMKQKAQKIFKKSDFNIGKKMGKGQFGQVMLVQHKQTGFLCGMKVMSKKEIRDQKYQNQIARQLSIQFYLSHRNITPLYGYFDDEENIYLLVEFCTDGQLLQKLRKNRRMEEEEVSPIIRQICQGLDYIHVQEIIHRDIKPENILFNYGTVKISDFGWAVHSGQGMRKTVSGSPLYYSPEIVQQTLYDEKIDIWAIGMMTYECILGKIPFRIYSELDLKRIVSDEISFPDYVDVTDEAKDFILKIMKKKPEDRMDLRQILRHPFITKHARGKKMPAQTLQEFKSVLTC